MAFYVPKITAVSLDPNPVDADAPLSIQVTVIEQLVYSSAELYAETSLQNGSLFAPCDFGLPAYPTND